MTENEILANIEEMKKREDAAQTHDDREFATALRRRWEYNLSELRAGRLCGALLPTLTTASGARDAGIGVFPDPDGSGAHWVVFNGELQSPAYNSPEAATMQLTRLQRGLARPNPYYGGV